MQENNNRKGVTMKDFKTLIAEAIRPKGKPVSYDPTKGRYNGQKVTRGDVFVDKTGEEFVLDRANGFILTLLSIRKSGSLGNAFSISVDSGDTSGYRALWLTGRNYFAEQQKKKTGYIPLSYGG